MMLVFYILMQSYDVDVFQNRMEATPNAHSEERGQRREVRGERSDERGQMREVRGERSEERGQMRERSEIF
jgi:hypothetical protein